LAGEIDNSPTLARALLINAPIFLFDEATANLDPTTERQVLDNLFQAVQGHSLLMITYWLVGQQKMDKILVFDNGKVVECGTHDSLMAKNGLYQQLSDMQNHFLANNIDA
jgi:ABC-type transport system involved in cytochrome bd biosynthesis fused ATPase/permease subunit